MLYAEGRPSAKDASGSGGNWSIGTKSQPTGFGVVTVESRFFFEGTVAPTDLDRATDVRGKGRMGIFGSYDEFTSTEARATSRSCGHRLLDNANREGPSCGDGSRVFIRGLRMRSQDGYTPSEAVERLRVGTVGRLAVGGCGKMITSTEARATREEQALRPASTRESQARRLALPEKDRR